MLASVGLLTALACLAASSSWAFGRRARADAVASVAVGLALTIGSVAALGTLLAVLGRFTGGWLAAVLACEAVALALVGARAPVDVPDVANGETTGNFESGGAPWPWWTGVALAALVVLGLGLRLPDIEAPLAGRDQGTYALRARALVRAGGVTVTNDALAEASQAADADPRAADVAGLYDEDQLPAHRGRYESGYRPGLYVTDRDTGALVPQFLHGLPVLLGTSLIAVGDPVGVAVLVTIITMLGLWSVARRLWPDARSPWPWVITTALAVSPLAIWTTRTPLTEGPTACLWIGAAVAALEAARRDEPSAWPWAAACLGAAAFLRGNAWLVLPAVWVGVLWREPAPPETGAPRTVALALVTAASLTSLALHGATSFPYLHDELTRIGLEFVADAAVIRPVISLALLTLAGVFVVALDRWLDGAGAAVRRRLADAHPWLQRALLLIAGAGVVRYLVAHLQRWAHEELDQPPWSRLDPALPLLGWPVLLLALVGLGARLRTVASDDWRGANAAWWWGLCTIPAVTCWLYAAHNLPRMGLYYYGRYLVPELLPATLLAACAGLDVLTAARRVDDGSRPGAAAVAARIGLVVGASLLIAVPGWRLISAPQTRLREFEDAAGVVATLDDRLETDALLIAGGEGWHHAHTFNHVGGALELGRGREVLRYHSREAAYASMHARLLDDDGAPYPAPVRPVYVLINEATKARTADDGALEAGFDPGLYPPFVAERIDLVEMFVHRLTPSLRAIPTRVTRDHLRMGLVRVGVDPRRAAQIISVRGEALGPAAARCLSADRSVRVDLGDALREADGAGHLVVVLDPTAAPFADRVVVRVDGVALGGHPPGTLGRQHATHGPWLLDAPPRRLEIRAGGVPGPGACARGSVTEVRWLPLSETPQAKAPPTAYPPTITSTRIEPPDDLGHPIAPTRWVIARALSLHRPGTTRRDGPIEVRGTGMVLPVDDELRFAPFALPALADPSGATSQARPWTVLVTLVGSHPGPNAQLELWIDGALAGRFSPPADAKGSWQAPPLTAPGRGDPVDVALRLRGGAPGGYVLVRDVAWFGPRLVDEP